MPSLFDDLARSYDRTFTNTVLGGLLRNAVHEEIRQVFRSGDRLLDIGCGTGEDALRLARRGISVTGIDASTVMIARARAKSEGERRTRPPVPHPSIEGQPHVAFEVRDFVEKGLPSGPFDGALANFGVVNCLRDVKGFAEDLRRSLKPQARVAIVAMGRFCVWDWLWFALQSRPNYAARRISGRAPFNGAEIRYWTPAELESEFRSFFRPVGCRPIGLLLPPTFAVSAAERHPAVARMLAAAERPLRRAQLGSLLSDHFLIALERL